MNSFEFLTWDTAFFGYKVARVAINSESLEDYRQTLRRIKEEQVRLAYIFVSPQLDKMNKTIVESGGLLVDKKVIFCKQSASHSGFRNSVKEYQWNGEENELTELALQAGMFSRFKIDRNFRKGEYERLYKRWLANSLNGQIAFKVIVAQTKGKLSGLITLGAKDDFADIGLLAVDRAYSGLGIGTDLVSYADNEAYIKHFSEIKVVTQSDNERACSLYIKCGFTVESQTNVYHLWL